MDAQQQLIQRYLDGACDAAEAATAQKLLESKPELRQQEELHSDLAGLWQARQATLRPSDQDELAESIMNALPKQAPEAEPMLSIANMAMLFIMLSIIGLTFNLVGTFGDLLNLSLIAALSCGVGIILTALARPLRQAEASLFDRLLSKRVSISQMDVITYRVAGIALVIGAAWLAAL